VLYGNPHDTQQWCESLEQHQQQFCHAPKQASADRGVFSKLNETFAKELGRVFKPFDPPQPELKRGEN
jgi:IS5 family transposase